MTSPFPSDDDIQAYIDHRLPAASRAALDRTLADDPALAKRIAAYQRQSALLQAAFSPVVEEPLPARMLQALNRTTPRRWPAVAGILLALGVGAGAGWAGRAYTTSPDGNTLTTLSRQALGAYQIYAAEGRHAVEVSANEETHLISWLSKRVGAPLGVPKLTKAGFHLVGGRLVAEGRLPVALLLYENDQGQRVTLYVRACGGAVDTPVRFASDGAVSAFYWIDEPLAMALTSDLPRDALAQLARMVYDELPFELGKSPKG